MALTVTKSWAAADKITASDLNANFTDVKNKFNAAIVGTELSSSAAIANGQLANSIYEIVVNMSVLGTQWAVAAAGEVVALAGLPADVNSESYTIIQADWAISCTATGITVAPVFDVDWGYFGTDTAWTQTTAVKANQSIGTITANRGSAATMGSVAATVTTSTTNKNFFAILLDTAGTGFATVDQVLTVSIKLKRTNGLRA